MRQRVAIVEDDQDVAKRFAELLRDADSSLEIDLLHSVEVAEAAFQKTSYDLVVMDVMFGHDHFAGFGMINSINRKPGSPTPILVVSGLQAEQFKMIFKKLSVHDYLEKPVENWVFVPTAIEILKEKKEADARTPVKATASSGLALDPLKHDPIWNGKKFSLTITAQRILHAIYEARPNTVTYEELYKLVKSGKTKENIRKYVNDIKEGIREVDETLDAIKPDRLKGYFWQS